MNDMIQTVAVYALPVLFAITLHEAAHAYAAKYFGDMTAYQQGRMSLNPIRHIDPFGTILIPIMLYFATGGAFLFGYAKPVPVDFSRLRNPKKQMGWVALAGPAANLLMALLWMIFGMLLAGFHANELFFMRMAQAGVLVNLVIFALNLFPLLPLDGGRILTSMLPHKYAMQFSRIEPYGFFILIGLMLLHVLQYWLVPVMMMANFLLKLIVSPLNFLLN
jgi:Zn-dependent protease